MSIELKEVQASENKEDNKPAKRGRGRPRTRTDEERKEIKKKCDLAYQKKRYHEDKEFRKKKLKLNKEDDKKEDIYYNFKKTDKKVVIEITIPHFDN